MKINDADIAEWSRSWQGVKEDISYGDELVKIFKPFIDSLKIQKLSPKSINSHIDNLWRLGGHIISQLNYYDENRQVPPYQMVINCIDTGDGPLIHEFSDYQQERFDATCRKLYKFLLKKKS